MIKVTIDGKEWNLTTQKTAGRVIESPSGKTVIQYDATLWKYLEE
tara:strand:- start:212 stop:346 length:135 start_codon:yes stop_codon:yes gene_type:complete